MVEREDSESTASEPDANLALVQRQASKLAEEPSASEPDQNLELASETQQDVKLPSFYLYPSAHPFIRQSVSPSVRPFTKKKNKFQ